MIPARPQLYTGARSTNLNLEDDVVPNFLFVYRSEPFDVSKVSPEQMQHSMDHWSKWIGQGFAEGWLLDAGDALLPEGRLVSRDRVVTDGPFVESKEVVGGYSVIKAASFDEAITHAKTCPNVTEGGNIEIRQMAGLTASKG
jgi:hypothetical protein